LGQSIDRSLAGVRFEETYLATIKQVREVIAGLRPSALNFGLELAINDLVDRLTETNRTTTVISLEIVKKSDNPPLRYPADVELQIYRIVQQACQNALQHASAGHIWVSGILEQERIQMSIIDDGRGFDINSVIDFEDLLKRKQYGLVGMAERAALVGARLAIVSAPGAGSEVSVHWRSGEKG